jgi:hypothetical protein
MNTRISLALFGLCLLVLRLTMVPTIYTLDSAELTMGAASLGIVHAPGYPLFLVIGHLFSWLPVGDVGFRINLLSAVSLALSAPLLFNLLLNLLDDVWAALAATLMFLWSYYVWTSGIVAEVYAPQIVTLAACGWGLSRMARQSPPTRGAALATGALYGVAVAMHPSSIFFAPGMAVAFGLLRVPWRTCLLAAGLGALCVGAALLYFPVRYAADPELNLAGSYRYDGSFEPVDLQSLQGIWWMLRGAQFEGLMFAAGYVPSTEALSLLVSNWLGIGVILGGIGLYVMGTQRRGLLVAWLALFVPFFYFYATYGAPDTETMFGPSYVLWAVTIAYGFKWITENSPLRLRIAAAIIAPAIFLAVNYPLVDSHDDHEIRDRSELLFATLPDQAAVFGVWWEVVPLQYLQMIEGQRQDVVIFNLFLLDARHLDRYLEGGMVAPDQPLIFLSEISAGYLADPDRYDLEPLWGDDTIRQEEIGGFRAEEQ